MEKLDKGVNNMKIQKDLNVFSDAEKKTLEFAENCISKTLEQRPEISKEVSYFLNSDECPVELKAFNAGAEKVSKSAYREGFATGSFITLLASLAFYGLFKMKNNNIAEKSNSEGNQNEKTNSTN